MQKKNIIQQMNDYYGTEYIKDGSKPHIDDIEINKIRISANFVMSDGSVVEDTVLDSDHLSDVTLTKIFDDLGSIKNPEVLTTKYKGK
mgnify:FL=1|tara:strand:+ start:182 stop:445 length:264 start_codon:yes stop_codon:yes gene_type:complete